MKRFLMLVGVAVVAGAMYVAASPASQQAKVPTARQFNALKKQVKTLGKNLKALKADEAQVKEAAAAAVGYIGSCFLNSDGSAIAVLTVGQFGNTTSGFLYGANGSFATPRTALDISAPSSSPLVHQLQEVNPSCTGSTTTALRHSARRLNGKLVQLWAARGR